MNWTAFDGGKSEAKVQQAEHNALADAEARRSLQEGLRLDVQRALVERDDARERLQVGQQGLGTARAGLDLARIRYQAGAGSATEVIDAGSAVAGAEATAIGATCDLWLAELKLARALGMDLESLL